MAGLVFCVVEALDLPWVFDYGARPVEFHQVGFAWRDGQLTANSVGIFSKLFTSLFLHGGPEHIVHNMVFLWTFGSLTAQLLGKWWALALFFVCGACGNILQICLNLESPIPIVGASGAICGFEGVYLGLALRWALAWPDVWPLARPIPPMQLAAFAILGVAFDLYSLVNHAQGVAYGAHLGGFLSGLIIGVIITWAYPAHGTFRSPRGR